MVNMNKNSIWNKLLQQNELQDKPTEYYATNGLPASYKKYECGLFYLITNQIKKLGAIKFTWKLEKNIRKRERGGGRENAIKKTDLVLAINGKKFPMAAIRRIFYSEITQKIGVRIPPTGRRRRADQGLSQPGSHDVQLTRPASTTSRSSKTSALSVTSEWV